MPKSSKVLNMCYRSWNCLMSRISSEEYWFTCCCWSIRSRWYVSAIFPINFSSEFEPLEEITTSHPVWKTKMTIWHLILVINMKDTENLAFCIVNLFCILFYIFFLIINLVICLYVIVQLWYHVGYWKGCSGIECRRMEIWQYYFHLSCRMYKTVQLFFRDDVNFVIVSTLVFFFFW